MGLSSSKSKTTTDQKTSQTGSTTPTNPPWVTDAIEQYTDRLGAFGDMDPNDFVAPASPLQRMAWDNAGSLADWQPQARLASQQALAAGQSGAHMAGPAKIWSPASGTAASYAAPRIGPAAMQAAQGVAAPTLGPAAQGNAASYKAPDIDRAEIVSARGYAAPSLGTASFYAGARVGQPAGAQSQSYAAQPFGGATIAPSVNASATDAAAASLLDNLGAYRNPYQRQVADASMADFDQYAGQQRAALAAQGARSGAFGGSRFGIAQGQLEGELSRARNASLSGLLSRGFETAAGLSQSDAANRQAAALFNAQNRTGISGANAAAANARASEQAGLQQQAGLFSAQQAADAARFGAESRERVGMFNSGNQLQAGLAEAEYAQQAAADAAKARNEFALSQAGLNADAGRFNATMGAQADALNQEAANRFTLERAAAAERAGQFSAGNVQQMELANAGFRNQNMIEQAGLAERARALSAQLGAQAAGANQQAANQHSLAEYAALEAAARANAGFGQDMALANLGYANQAGQYEAAAANDLARFNAGQMDLDDNRRMQSAGMLADIADRYGAGVRADLGLMGQLGDQQRGVEAQYAMAPLAQLQALGQLYGATPYSLFNGNAVSSNETMNGTNVTTQTPSLFNQMLAAASVASKFIP